MKSFSLLRTNTLLTTNIKLVVDSNYNLYMESIDSAPQLSTSKLKKVQFNKTNFWDELVPFFYKDFPVDIAYSVKYSNDNKNMSTDFNQQYDSTYLTGAQNISDNKNYSEEFEYFAPLYIFKHSLPKYFIIFRIDGPGLDILNKDNFKSNFLNKTKVVKVIDLTKETALGEWMFNNFSNNPSFPDWSLEVDFRELEFTRWIGIDLTSGGYASKSFYIDETLEKESTLYDLEKFFIDGYKNNKVVFPHIINFSFLFDDTPATPTDLRKWSLNRYAGFYINNLEEYHKISSFIVPQLKDDCVIDSGNIIYSTSSQNPFIKEYQRETAWVEYEGNFYKVVEFMDNSTTDVSVINKGGFKSEEISTISIKKYKIISELDLKGKQNLLNKRGCFINESNQLINIENNQPYQIEGIQLSDINIIKIGDKFHNLIYQDGIIQLNTDFGFRFSPNNKLEYFTNSGKEGFGFAIDLKITENNLPFGFPIYRVDFCDIKDFDTQIVDNQFSRFEYEKLNDLTKTEETKMYVTDLNSKSNPPTLVDFIFKGKTELIPTSSDYTANLETFRIESGDLTDMWRKNPLFCRWGYQNSISNSDYPYLLNNNTIHGEWNRTVDDKSIIPNRTSRNLDYFYTLNSGTTSYLHHSLHIEKNLDFQDSSFHFELDKYLNKDFDYFDYLFNNQQSFLDGNLIFNKNKFSQFNSGDRAEPNSTLFRGIKFSIYEVDSINISQGTIQNVNIFSSNKFEDYKFSILLSSNDLGINEDGNLYKPYFWDDFYDSSLTGTKFISTQNTVIGVTAGDLLEIEYDYPNSIFSDLFNTSLVTESNGRKIQFESEPSENNDNFFFLEQESNDVFTNLKFKPGRWRNKMQWEVIKEWEWDIEYDSGKFVVYNGSIYKSVVKNLISDPNQNPSNSTLWLIQNNFLGFWSYDTFYIDGDWVYRWGEFYKYKSSGTIDFWSPIKTYGISEKVIQDNFYWECIKVGKDKRPKNLSQFWKKINNLPFTDSNWVKINLWEAKSYPVNELVVYNRILYKNTSEVSLGESDIPGVSSGWERIYSFFPDTNYVYEEYSDVPCQNLIFTASESISLELTQDIEFEGEMNFNPIAKQLNVTYPIDFNYSEGEDLNVINTWAESYDSEVFGKIKNEPFTSIKAIEITKSSDIQYEMNIDYEFELGNYTPIVFQSTSNIKTFNFSVNSTARGFTISLPTVAIQDNYQTLGVFGTESIYYSPVLETAIINQNGGDIPIVFRTPALGTYSFNVQVPYNLNVNWILSGTNRFSVDLMVNTDSIPIGTVTLNSGSNTGTINGNVNLNINSFLGGTSSLYNQVIFIRARLSNIRTSGSSQNASINLGPITFDLTNFIPSGNPTFFSGFLSTSLWVVETDSDKNVLNTGLYPFQKEIELLPRFSLDGILSITASNISSLYGSATFSSSDFLLQGQDSIIKTSNGRRIFVYPVFKHSFLQSGLYYEPKYKIKSGSYLNVHLGKNICQDAGNSVIELNNSFYLCTHNPNLTLDNGITVYINKIFKNILVNIAINDNTINTNVKNILDKTRNIERDWLYDSANSRLTAANFISQLNSLDDLFGFADFTSYVVIEEDGSVKKFNKRKNLTNLPYVLLASGPDSFKLNAGNLVYNKITLDSSLIKPVRNLKNGEVDDLSKINFYNDIPLSVDIQENTEQKKNLINFNSFIESENTIWRHSGPYMPIFYEIDLFKKVNYTEESNCQIQFYLWLGTASTPTEVPVKFKIQTSDNVVEKVIRMIIPSSDSQEDVTNFYQQITTFLDEQEILKERNLEYQILFPGDEKIFVETDFSVLSIKYTSSVCDLKLSADEVEDLNLNFVPDFLVLEYLFEDGRDLDIRVRVTNDIVGQNSNAYPTAPFRSYIGYLGNAPQIQNRWPTDGSNSSTTTGWYNPQGILSLDDAVNRNLPDWLPIISCTGPSCSQVTIGIYTQSFGTSFTSQAWFSTFTQSLTNRPFIYWGGDNQGLGREQILIDLKRFQELYPDEKEIKIDSRAYWNVLIGREPIKISVTAYQGGYMQLWRRVYQVGEFSPQPPRQKFTNENFTDSKEFISSEKIITAFWNRYSYVEVDENLTWDLNSGVDFYALNIQLGPFRLWGGNDWPGIGLGNWPRRPYNELQGGIGTDYINFFRGTKGIIYDPKEVDSEVSKDVKFRLGDYSKFPEYTGGVVRTATVTSTGRVIGSSDVEPGPNFTDLPTATPTNITHNGNWKTRGQRIGTITYNLEGNYGFIDLDDKITPNELGE